MARPKSKSDLLIQANENYQRLLDFVEAFSKDEQEREFPAGSLTANIKDVLAHLHAWHLLLLDWYTIGMAGQIPDMPSKGYTWKTLPDLNLEIQKRYAQVSLDDAKGYSDNLFKTVLKIIECTLMKTSLPKRNTVDRFHLVGGLFDFRDLKSL